MGRKEIGFPNMKTKRLKIPSKQIALVITSLLLIACGCVLWLCGRPADYTPMCMASLLLLCLAFLLLSNALLPVLYKLLLIASNAEPRRKIWRFFPKAAGFLYKYGAFISAAVNLAILGAYGYIFYLHAVYVAKKTSVTYFHLFIFGMVFIAVMIGAMVVKHYCKDDSAKRSLSSIFAFLKFDLLVLVAACALTVTKVYDVNAYARIFEGIFGAYVGLFVIVSLAKDFIKKELATDPKTIIPVPFSSEKTEDDLIAYLESSTGLTLRSLFSIRYAKSIFPTAILVCGLLIWLATGVVQIEAYEQGALYRFGRCEEILEPGLHLTFPFPIDKVAVYNTENVRETVVGYDSKSGGNILWNESHGGTEYKLLIGEGFELVSVNIRIQYKIDDLRKYVTVSSNADAILNARAYSVVTDLTVGTDLDTIISRDRYELSQTIEKALAEYLADEPCGLCVTDVIIESIHPPVEVADVYQSMVSAEVEAQAAITKAKGEADATISYAELNRNAEIQLALAYQYEQLGAARGTVAEFLAMAEAYEEYPDEFTYYKYMDALAKTFSKQRLYILGEGVDEKYIYFGSGVILYN